MAGQVIHRARFRTATGLLIPLAATAAGAQTAPASTPVAPVTVQAAPQIRIGGPASCAPARNAPCPAAQVPGVAAPPIRLGFTTPAAVSQQFGNAFGKSVQPQRPAPPPIAPSPFTRRP